MIASPYGEAVCPECYMLIGLTADGRFERHGGASPLTGYPKVCPVTGALPAHEVTPHLPHDLPVAAFSSEPVMARCPVCGTQAKVNTFAYPQRRFYPHQMVVDTGGLWGHQGQPCPGGGEVVPGE